LHPDSKILILQDMAMCNPERSMSASPPRSTNVIHCSRAVVEALAAFGRFMVLTTRSRRSLAAENLFLRKRLALFQERQTKPRRATDSTRWLMVVLSRLFDWRGALVVVKPETLIRWHRKGFRLFWRWKSRPVGRPTLAKIFRS
jgi:hypothetical protein